MKRYPKLLLTVSLLAINTGLLQAVHAEPVRMGVAVQPSLEVSRFTEIQSLFKQGQIQKVIEKASEFEQYFPQSHYLSQVFNIYGLCLLQKKDIMNAEAQFKKAVQLTPTNSPILPYLKYNLANAQYELGRMSDAQNTLIDFDPSKVDRDNQLKYHYLSAKIYFEQKLYSESARQCIQASKLFSSTTSIDQSNTIGLLFDKNIQAIQDEVSLIALNKYAEGSIYAEKTLLKLTQIKVVEQTPAPAIVPATPIIESPTDESKVEPKKIGVLLPLTGKFARFGARALQGIELAFQIFDSKSSPPQTKYTLVIRDSGDDAESTTRALNQLARTDHVVGVIGPLLSKGIDSIAKKAQELQVPLISLSKSTVKSGEYFLNGGISLKMQALDLVKFSMQKLGAKRFAILYPRDKTGEENMHRFWDAVEELGGEVRAVESYPVGETDFRQFVDRLSGLYYVEARDRENRMLAKMREQNNVKKRTRKTEQFYALNPIVDYDAVFVPEEPRVAGQILPTFAYRDIDKVHFLGTSAWNSKDLPERALNTAEHAYFVETFLPTSLPAASQKYSDRFSATFQQEASAFDALAYDAAKLMLQALERAPEGHTHKSLAAELQRGEVYSGVTGKINVVDGILTRPLRIVTFKNSEPVEVTQ